MTLQVSSKLSEQKPGQFQPQDNNPDGIRAFDRGRAFHI